MSVPTTYDIHTDIPFPALSLIDAGRLAAGSPSKWWNQSLARVNDCVIRLGVFEGEFHWHKHDREDEYFHVVEGELLLDLEPVGGDAAALAGNGRTAVPGRTVALKPAQGMLVPRNVVHRTRAPARTVVLMFEAATVTPTGD
ncbi:MAG TPA: cupin domain-containing protein [Phycisphaerales bacterium]|nr:cupin domain-containing protein [Phycisphaerales bacterium]